MNYKPLLALLTITIVGIASWELGWILWEQKELWQYMTNIEYQNMLLIAEIIQASTILATTAISTIKPKNQTPTNQQQKHAIKEKQISTIKNQISKIEKELANLQATYKLDPTIKKKEKGGDKT